MWKIGLLILATFACNVMASNSLYAQSESINSNLKELSNKSESIIIGTATKLTEENGSSIANFKIDKIVEGPPFPGYLPVRFVSQNKMPLVGSNSKWIIFIENAVSKRGAFDTANKSSGLIEANDKNLAILQQLFPDKKITVKDKQKR